MSIVYPVQRPDAAARLMAFVSSFDPKARTAGREAFTKGQVQSIEATDERTIAARVVGKGSYEVQLTLLGTTWWSECSCAAAQRCLHVVAAALAWEKQLNGGYEPPPEGGEKSADVSASPRRSEARSEWQVALEGKLGRPLSASEVAFLVKISKTFRRFVQGGALWANDLADLGLDTEQARAPAYTRAYEGWWSEPPASPQELWQYIAFDLHSSGRPIPDFMAPLTDLESVRPSVEAALRRRAAQEWLARFRAKASKYASDGYEPRRQFLDLRIRVAGREIDLQTRSAPDGPWKDVSVAGLKRLVEENAAAQVEASLPVLTSLVLIGAYHENDYNGLVRAEIIAPGLLNQILWHPRARECVVGADGSPIRFHDERLVWKVLPAADSADHYVTTLTLPGSDAPLGDLLPLPGRPNLYLDGQTVYRGPAPFAEPGERVPREAIEHPTTLLQLQTLGARLPSELMARFVTVPLRMRFECDLDELDFLLFKLLAVSPEGRIEKTWTGAEWEDAAKGQGTATETKEKVRVFEYTAAEPATAALRELNLNYQPFLSAWRGRLHPSFADEFVAWRARLPKEIEVVAKGDLTSLLEDPVRARIDFNLLPTQASRDWFDLALALRTDDDRLTPEEIALLLKARGKFVRLSGKGWKRLTVEVDETAKDAAGAIGLNPEALAEAGLAGEKHRFHLLQISQSKITDYLPERQAAQLRSQAMTLVSPEPPALPEGLRAELRPYQAEGFRFLAFLSANRLGGVLADDMGLGKTLQTLTWLLWLLQAPPTKTLPKVLVVCPKSVMGNWESEAARFAPGLYVLRFTPALAEKPLPDSDGRPLVVVANYTQLRLHESFFRASEWKAIVLDEGQFIKNPGSKVAQIARELPSEQRVVLTGTPIENRLLDLWSLFSFALPGLLGSQAHFRRQFEDTDPHAVARLRRRVRHFLLRRTKSQVATDLPARTEEDVPIELEGEQLQLYQAELKDARAQLLKVKTEGQLDKVRFNILASLLRLRQICCHPALVNPAFADAGSAKLDALMERVEELRDEGHQVLVFSQFVEMLKLIQQQLVATKIPHLLLTGQTEDRDKLVKEFQTNKTQTVFLLSLKAAGFGLNLTAASYVILYDPWWNPAVEAQAIDRTHRIGQVNAVNAYRFVARGTVEEKIRALQKEKSALAGAVVQEESLSRLLDLETLRQVLL